jgi:hypothetical protein
MKMKITTLPTSRNRQEWSIGPNVTLTGSDLRYPNVLLHTAEELATPYNEKTMSTGVTSAYPSGEYEPSMSTCSHRVGRSFFFIYNTDNYFHFLYDSLPYLFDYLRLRADEPVKLLMSSGPHYPFVTDCLRLLNIQETDIVYADGNASYEEVILVNSMTHDGHSNEPPHPHVWELYKKMVSLASQNPIDTPKKFYVSRRSWIHGDTSNMGTNYTTRRKMMVEDELVQRLAENGYAEVFCEKLTMAEKIQYFANATHVVGAIGGGMCNLVFARPECVVVSINSPEFDTINSRFLYTMSHTNLTQFRETAPTNGLYRRVRYRDSIGEVEGVADDKIQLNIGNGVTWNNDGAKNYQWVPIGEVEFLDNGLNSPWSFDVDKCMSTIQ